MKKWMQGHDYFGFYPGAGCTFLLEFRLSLHLEIMTALDRAAFTCAGEAPPPWLENPDDKNDRADYVSESDEDDAEETPSQDTSPPQDHSNEMLSSGMYGGMDHGARDPLLEECYTPFDRQGPIGTTNILRLRQVKVGPRPPHEGPAVLSIYILTYLWGPTPAAQLDGFMDGKRHMKRYAQRGWANSLLEATEEWQAKIYEDISADFNVWAAGLIRRTELADQDREGEVLRRAGLGENASARGRSSQEYPATPPPRRACQHADAAQHLAEWRPMGEGGHHTRRSYRILMPELPLRIAGDASESASN